MQAIVSETGPGCVGLRTSRSAGTIGTRERFGNMPHLVESAQILTTWRDQ
jgi:hypothetical protein